MVLAEGGVLLVAPLLKAEVRRVVRWSCDVTDPPPARLRLSLYTSLVNKYKSYISVLQVAYTMLDSLDMFM